MSYALAPSRRRFVLYALLLVSALFTLERTVWLTMFLLASSFYVLRSKGTFRWLAPPLLALLAVTAVLTYKPFYNRFFYRALPSGQSLSLSTLPLNTNGRNAAWDSILHRVDRSTFLYGRGMGAADDYFQNVLHGSLNGVVHNEYLRLLYDAGILAPALLVLALILLIAAALRWRGDPTIRAVLVGMAVAYPFAALIDNAVDYYAYVGTGLAVLAGIFLSMSMHSQATRAEQDPPTEGFPERRLVTSGSR